MRLGVLMRDDPEEMNREIVQTVVNVLEHSLQERSRATVFLAGGSTPRPIYELLARDFGQKLPWERIRLFWGDERWVQPDDPLSNQRMARETLIARVPIPPRNVFPIPTDGAPEEAAARYDRLLREQFAEPVARPDLVLLGLGPEGHTASLFPQSPALSDKNRWATAVRVNAAPPQRLTVTLGFINRARHVFFLVAGEKKADIVRKILVEEPTVEQCPASGVRPTEGELTWWLDAASTARLPRFFRPSGRERVST
ncbi:MAG: 6-phosphogluconolactonase [Acidobacteriota bacterium]